MSIEKLTHEQITDYINQSFTEDVIRKYEDQLLRVMKTRYEKYPTKKNDQEWLEYTNFVCRRRCQSQQKQ